MIKKSTILRELTKRGWVSLRDPDPDGSVHLMMDGCAGSRIFCTVESSWRIKMHDARLIGSPNVHIVSYWGPFRSMADMHEKLDAAEDVYRRLCRTYFPTRAEKLSLQRGRRRKR